MSDDGVVGGNLCSRSRDNAGALRERGSRRDFHLVRFRDFLDGLNHLATVRQDGFDLFHFDDGLADFSWLGHDDSRVVGGWRRRMSRCNEHGGE